MTASPIIDLSRFRIVELSRPITPGREVRRLQIRPYRMYVGEIMHDVDMMSHVGTHVEAPSHYVDALPGDQKGADLAAIPAETWLGDAVFVDLSELAPGEAITPAHLERVGVRRGDIVLIGNSRATRREDVQHVRRDAAKWLADTGVKLVGFDDTAGIEEIFEALETMYTHRHLLSNGIPMIEMLVNLDQLRARRFFFIGLPYRVVGLDGWPIRALALEPLE